MNLLAQVFPNNNLKPSFRLPRRSLLATWSIITTSFTLLCFSRFIIAPLFAFFSTNIFPDARYSKGVYQRTASRLPWTILLAVKIFTVTLPFSTVSAWLSTLPGSSVSSLAATISDSTWYIIFGIGVDNWSPSWRCHSVTSFITPFPFVHRSWSSASASVGASRRHSVAVFDWEAHCHRRSSAASACGSQCYISAYSFVLHVNALLTPSHSSIIIGAPLVTLLALIREAPLLSLTEKRIVGGASLPPLPVVLRVPLSSLLSSTTTIRFINKGKFCRNMYGHALIGRPAPRLEMVALVLCSYVLVCIVGKRR